MKRKYSTAKELRTAARNRLKDRWGVAVVAFLIVALLGAGGFTFQYNFGSSGVTVEDELIYEYEDAVASETENLEQTLADENLTEENVGEYDLLYQYRYDTDHSEYIVDTIYTVLLLVMVAVIAALVFGLISLYHIFIGAPLTTGYYRFNLKLFKTRREVSLNLLLNGFRKSFLHSAGVAFLSGLVMLGAVLLSFLPAIVLVVIGVGLASDTVWFLAVLAFALGFFICGVRLAVISLRYSMCFYILAEHPDRKARDVLRESKEMMKGHKWRLFRLRLSFLGWMFLSLFTCGIGMLWVGAYMQAAETAFYRELVRGGKRQTLLESLFSGN